MNITSAEFAKGIRGTDPITMDGRAEVAFIGRSNVGKSSLINALLGEKDLVKVGKKPGKTTEINFFLVNKLFYFVDLPGYGYARVNPKEKEKIKKLIWWYMTSTEVSPKLIVLVLDAQVGVTEFDQQTIEVLREYHHPFIIVLNKSDKLNQKELAHQLASVRSAVGDTDVVICSSSVRSGARDLLDKIII